MMDELEIKEIIEKHQHWIKKDCDGWENMRANLCKANLQNVNLWGANLYGANLCGANLYGSDLYSANLCKANLQNVNLCGANLYGADLCEADLRGANLYGSNLFGADLREADLRETDLYGTNMCEANLYGVNLCEADLYGTNLYGGSLCGANLYGAKGAYLREVNMCGANNIPFIPYTCPDFGTFTGFKKAQGLIVVLEIPKDARRLSATGRKCRCDKAKVIDIQNIDGTKADVTSVSSDWDDAFIYEVGKEVCVSDFDEDRWNECSTGIHFFINRQEAVDYM